MKNDRLSSRHIVGRLVKYLFWAAAAVIIFSLFLLAGAYNNLKAVALSGLAGKNSLSAAVTAGVSQDWSAGVHAAATARQEFAGALSNLERTRKNSAVRYIPPIRTQINDLEYLLRTGEILSRSLEKIFPLAQGLDNIRAASTSGSFADLPAAEKQRFLQYIYESEPELNGLRANLELASLNLDRIHRIGVLWPVYAEISDIRRELAQTAQMLAKTSPLLKMLPALTGYPGESRFLIIMQNNDELRPAGGFIGVYGLLELQNGEIKRLETDDSYHVDMPASLSDKWQTPPPDILGKYLEVEKWYLRDANWSPDWSVSARLVEHVYNGVIGAAGQAAQPFTGIIGITPDLVADLIRLVGPITVRGETYTPENFQPLLQYNVEIAYRDQDISQWDRKDIVDELLAELKTRLFHLPPDKWSALFKTFNETVAQRDIQLFFHNQDWQKYVQELGASGEVRRPAGDFLMVVDANLAAFKSDAVVRKTISYSVREKADGLEASVKLNYDHEGGFDWRTTRYRSYTRIYAPLGSSFISLVGVNEATADQSISADTALDKAVFGFFFTVEPGADREVTLRYRLPDYLYEQWRAGDYTLLVQKQAGRRTESLSAGFWPIKGRSGEWTTDLSTDKEFWFDLRK